MVRPKTTPPRGVLHARMTPGHGGYELFWPDADLAPFVEHFWSISMQFDVPEMAEVLPHPCVQLVIEPGPAQADGAGISCLHGVPEGRFTRRLDGPVRALGAKFRPGAFRPFLSSMPGRPQRVSELTGKRLPLAEAFGPGGRALERAALAQTTPQAAFHQFELFLRDLKPQVDPKAELAATIAARVEGDRGIVRVDRLAQTFDLSTRALQRLFGDYVGVSPKWVIQRYRLHEAAEQIASGTPEWTALAHDLGYADQAHFIRDFSKVVGRTPRQHAERARAR